MIKELKDYIPKSVLVNKNRARTWLYGYNLKYDLVIISKTGQIGKVIQISNVRIGLPKAPKEIYKRLSKGNLSAYSKKNIKKNYRQIILELKKSRSNIYKLIHTFRRVLRVLTHRKSL